MQKRQKNQMKTEPSIHSVSYVHDPEAAEKWFAIYVELIKKKLLELVSSDVD